MVIHAHVLLHPCGPHGHRLEPGRHVVAGRRGGRRHCPGNSFGLRNRRSPLAGMAQGDAPHRAPRLEYLFIPSGRWQTGPVGFGHCPLVAHSAIALSRSPQRGERFADCRFGLGVADGLARRGHLDGANPAVGSKLVLRHRNLGDRGLGAVGRATHRRVAREHDPGGQARIRPRRGKAGFLSRLPRRTGGGYRLQLRGDRRSWRRRRLATYPARSAPARRPEAGGQVSRAFVRRDLSLGRHERL